MKFPISCTALGLALVAGAPAAQAQTVITREIVDQPVETVIAQQPTETVVAEQPLVTVPAATVLQPETVQTTETIRPRPVRLRTGRRRVRDDTDDHAAHRPGADRGRAHRDGDAAAAL